MVESPRSAAGVYGINNRRRSIFSVRDRRASRRQAAKDSETDRLAPLLARILTGGLCGASLCAAAGKSLLTGAPGRNRRRDRSVRRLPGPEVSREQSAHQRSLCGHLRRFGCDCSSLFPSLALTQTRPIPISLFLHGRSPVASLGI